MEFTLYNKRYQITRRGHILNDGVDGWVMQVANAVSGKVVCSFFVPATERHEEQIIKRAKNAMGVRY